jgi:hypothetical protein
MKNNYLFKSLLIILNQLKTLEIMKKSKFQGKLSLNKETVARLNDAQMNGVMGGTNYLLLTLKCPVLVIPTRTIPPCTISTNTIDKTVIDTSVVVRF